MPRLDTAAPAQATRPFAPPPLSEAATSRRTRARKVSGSEAGSSMEQSPLPMLLKMAEDWPAPLLWGLIQKAYPNWAPAKQVALRTTLTYRPLANKASELAATYTSEADKAAAIEGVAAWLAREMKRLAERWAHHPQCSSGEAAHVQEKPWEAEVLVVITHRPGRDGRRMSLYQASFTEALTPKAWEWQESRMVGGDGNGGQFAGFAAIPHEWTVDTRRTGYINNSAATQGSRGYFARERLKSLFPPRSRKWIGKLRKWNRRSKEDLLAEVTGEPWKLVPKSNGRPNQKRMVHCKDGRKRRTPSWYRNQTKGEIIMSKVVPDVVMHAAKGIFEDPQQLWDASRGKVHPADLDDLLLSPRERRNRKARYREDRIAWSRIEKERSGQQTLDL